MHASILRGNFANIEYQILLFQHLDKLYNEAACKDCPQRNVEKKALQTHPGKQGEGAPLMTLIRRSPMTAKEGKDHAKRQ